MGIPNGRFSILPGLSIQTLLTGLAFWLFTRLREMYGGYYVPNSLLIESLEWYCSPGLWEVLVGQKRNCQLPILAPFGVSLCDSLLSQVRTDDDSDVPLLTLLIDSC